MRTYALVAAVLLLGASSAFAEKVVLTTGDVIYGPVLGRDNGVITVKHPVLGELKIPEQQVLSVTVEPAPTEAKRPDMPPTVAPQPATGPAPKPEAEKPAEPEKPKATTWLDRYREQWDSSLELGASATTGNTEKSSLFFSLKSKREREDIDRTKWDNGARWASSNSDETENEATAGITHDWLLKDSKWFYFATGRYDYDEFQSWNHRVTTALGIGHNTIEKDDFTWINRAGLGMIFELNSEEDDARPEGYLGTEVSWKITDSQTLAASSTYHPDLTNPMEFRWVNKAEWTVKINQADGLRLKLGLEHEHDSEVDPGTKHDDLKIYSSLIFDF